MKLQTYNNSHLVVQDEYNNVIGLLSASKEVEPALLLCLHSEYDCHIEITKTEQPDSNGVAFFTIACLEEGADTTYDREISVSPVWLFE